MAKRIETYPNIDELKERVEFLKKFGWKEAVSVTERAVYEVEFTRDESKPRNRELKKLETQLLQANTALDFIDRYSYKTVNKKSFKAFGKLSLFILIYIFLTFLAGALVCSGIKFAYTSNPQILIDLDIQPTVNGETIPLDGSWSQTINLADTEAANMIPFLESIGIKSEITITLDTIMNILFAVGIAFGLMALAILIFIIYRKSKVKSYYKAEVEYVQRRKYLLEDKIYDIQNDIINIMKKVETV